MILLSHSDTISFHCRTNHLFPARQYDYLCPADIKCPKVVHRVCIIPTIITTSPLTTSTFSELYQYTSFLHYSFASELHLSSSISCTSALAEIFGWPVHLVQLQPLYPSHRVLALAISFCLMMMYRACVIQGVFSVLLYFLVDLQRTVSQFLWVVSCLPVYTTNLIRLSDSIFLLVVFTMTTTMKGFFRLVAAAFKEESSVTSVVGIGVLVFSLYTGYTIPRLSILGALRWITYLNVGWRLVFQVLCWNIYCSLSSSVLNHWWWTNFILWAGHALPWSHENVLLANQVCTSLHGTGSLPSCTCISPCIV